jgi:hypothetical protein
MSTESTPNTPIPTIQVLFFAPDAYPVVRTIPNTLEAKQELVEGLITTFDTGIPGTIGVANDEALVQDMDPNRLIPATGAHIFGPFFVAGDIEGGFRSLAPRELELALDHLAPEVPQRAFTALMHELEGGREWMENWE